MSRVFLVVVAAVAMVSASASASRGVSLSYRNPARLPAHITLLSDFPAPSAVVAFSIRLPLQNLAALEELHRRVSDPDDARFGQYASKAELDALVRPDEAHFAAVERHLHDHDVRDFTRTADGFSVRATVQQTEKLWSTVMRQFRDALRNKVLVRHVDHLYVPESLRHAISMVTGLSEFDTPGHVSFTPRKSSAFETKDQDDGDDDDDDGDVLIDNVQPEDLSPQKIELPDDLITSQHSLHDLRALYKIPQALTNMNPMNRQAVASFASSFDPEALLEFQGANDLPERNVSRELQASEQLGNGGANLAMQYLMGMAPGVDTWFFHQGEGNWLLALLDAVDGLDTPPWVVLIDYAWSEEDQCNLGSPTGPGRECHQYDSTTYTSRANALFQKLGARGVTVIVSSGTRGAAGPSTSCPLVPLEKNRCAQVQVINGGNTCNFPLGCGPIWENSDCIRAFDQLVSMSQTKNCAVRVSGYRSADRQFMSSSCDCDQLFSGDTLEIRVDTCSIRRYEFDPASSDNRPLVGLFPASSPYVTTVGSTALARAPLPLCRTKDVLCPAGEVSASALDGLLVTSGGGFSVYSKVPDYQKSAVDTYFNLASAELEPLRSVAGIKKILEKPMRGYPDIAMIGPGCKMVLPRAGGEQTPADDQSCAAAAFAGMVSLINGMLLDRGKSPVGFLNPTLYKMARERPEAYNDIVTGDNRCMDDPAKCCKFGYWAKKGWDPVTGLGSPNFEQLVPYVLNAAPAAKQLGHQEGKSYDPFLTVPIVVGIGILCLFLAMIPGAVYGALAEQLSRLIVKVVTPSAAAAPEEEKTQTDERSAAGGGILDSLMFLASGTPKREYKRKRKGRSLKVEDFGDEGEEDDIEGNKGIFKTPSTATLLSTDKSDKK